VCGCLTAADILLRSHRTGLALHHSITPDLWRFGRQTMRWTYGRRTIWRHRNRRLIANLPEIVISNFFSLSSCVFISLSELSSCPFVSLSEPPLLPDISLVLSTLTSAPVGWLPLACYSSGFCGDIVDFNFHSSCVEYCSRMLKYIFMSLVVIVQVEHYIRAQARASSIMPKLFHLSEDASLIATTPPSSPTKHSGERFSVKVPMQGFFIDEIQRETILTLYNSNSDKIERMEYRDTTLSQSRANAFLEHHKLDQISLEQLESRWTVSWNNKWISGKETKKRVLYQWYIIFSCN